jgi:aerobic carbon-monoxide dehydrogenase medium subunit
VISRPLKRTLPVSEFITGFYSNALEAGEILKAIILPRPRRNHHAVYLKYISRSSEDRPCVGIAVAAQRRDSRLKRLRVVVGAVASTPQLFPDIIATLENGDLTDAQITECAEAYASRITPMEDQRGSGWYRRRMVVVHIRGGWTATRDALGAMIR